MAIEATIVTKVDNSQSIKAQQDLRKEIKSLRTELNGLNASTEKYATLLKQITQLTETYQQKVLATKQVGTQFNDIVKTNVNMLVGVKKGFDDAAKSINLYANAQGNVKTLDKVTNISAGVNTRTNIKGDFDKSLTDGLSRQIIMSGQANKSLSSLSNIYAGLGTSILSTNNAISQQGGQLNNVTTTSKELDRVIKDTTINYSLEEDAVREDTSAIYENTKNLLLNSDAQLKTKENIEFNIQAIKKGITTNKAYQTVLNETLRQAREISSTGGTMGDALNAALIKLNNNAKSTTNTINTYNNAAEKLRAANATLFSSDISILGQSKLQKGIEKATNTINNETKSLALLKQELKEIAKIERLQKEVTKPKDVIPKDTTKELEKDSKAKVENSKASAVAAQRSTMLAFSMAQIIREVPVAAMRMDMFFLAISNNIPMFADQIKNMKAYNAQMKEAGKPGLSIGKELFKSLASGNTIMMVAVTLLTTYGAKLIGWAKSVWIGTEALEAQEKAIKDNAESYDMINKRAKEAASSLATLNLMYSQWTNIKSANLATRQKWFDEHKETLAKVGKGYKDLKSLEADWAVNGIKNYQEGIMKRAEASAAFNKLVELYERRLVLTDKERLKDLTAWQREVNSLGQNARNIQKQITEIENNIKSKKIVESDAVLIQLRGLRNQLKWAISDSEDLQKKIKEGEIATIASNAVEVAEIDKQINAYSKVGDVKEEDIKNTKESGKTAAEFATDLSKQYTSLGITITDFYTEQKSGLDTWLKDQEDKYLKGSISEAEFVKRKGQYNEKLNELDKLQVEYEYQNLIKSIADKKEAIRLEYEAKLAENKKDHKNNAEINKKANDIKTKSEANLTIELENALKTRNAKISDLEIKGKDNSIINNKEYVDAIINEFDRLYQELIFKQGLFNNQISEQILKKQSGKSFFEDLFSTDELQNELDNFDNIINQSTSTLAAKSGKKSFLESSLKSLTENTPEYLAKQKEINSLEQEMSDERVKIAQAEADKKKAINDDWMANAEAYATTATSSFQAVIDTVDASYEKQTNVAKENYDKDINNYNQQLKDKKITQEQYDAYVKARESEFSKKNLDLQSKQNNKRRGWEAGIAMVDGLVGAGKALSGAMELGPIAGPIVGGVQSAAILASTAATVKKIFAQRVSDSGSGGSVSSATTSAISSPLNYSASVLTSTQEQEINKPQKVYVLSSEIEAASKSNKVIVAESTF